MKLKSNPQEIAFWCENGVPVDEIVRRIHERSTEECQTAYRWITDWFPREAGIHICAMADGLRSSAEVMKILTPLFEREGIPLRKRNLMMELSCLAVEAGVRVSKQLRPSES